jgi:hypothetical protein
MWEFFGPIHDDVQRGRSVHVADFQVFLSRDRQHEELYVTFDYTPIRQESSGTVQGVFCTCVDSTEKIISGRRLATLRDLVHPTMKNQPIDVVCKKVAAVIDANPLDIPFAAIYLPGDNQGEARRISAVRLASDSSALPEVLSVAEMTAKIPAWPLNEISETHQVMEINHLQSQIGSFRAPILGDEVEAGIIYPLTRTWQQRPAGFLIAGLSPYRVFDADYRSFFELTGRQILNSISDAYALELDHGRRSGRGAIV